LPNELIGTVVLPRGPVKNHTRIVQCGIDAAGKRLQNFNMKFITTTFALAAAVLWLPFSAVAQTNAPGAIAIAAQPAVHTNSAIIPVSRTGGMTNRQSLVIQRARENPGDYDIEFIGDSITQGWEGSGKNVWQEFYGQRKCINMGVSGDQTQHVLWRFEHGQLDGIKAKAAVVMIGTNNSNNNRTGAEDYSTGDILEGVQAIVQQIRTRQPDTKIILLGIFPRGQTFSPQRGKILQVNQALARLDDGKNIFCIDIGPQLIENDGSISRTKMRDYLHPGEAGYKIWANAIEPKLKELLAGK
jgi:lysophospholipase L1-like esterase